MKQDSWRENLRVRWQKIREEIPATVRLIAVTKTVGVETIKLAYQEGIKDFGENRLQDATPKQEQLKDYNDICWHFIGHLQTNKAKRVVECFSWIHSVDSLKLAQKLDEYSRQAKEAGRIADYSQVCLQVKLLPDENKYGWHPQQLWQDLDSLQSLSHLHFRGLMTILPLGLSQEEMFSAFTRLRELKEEIRQAGYFDDKFDQLSMGMSDDYKLAIKAGATMIRLGRILFHEAYPLP